MVVFSLSLQGNLGPAQIHLGRNIVRLFGCHKNYIYGDAVNPLRRRWALIEFLAAKNADNEHSDQHGSGAAEMATEMSG